MNNPETTAIEFSLTNLTGLLSIASIEADEADETAIQARGEVLRLEAIQTTLNGMLNGLLVVDELVETKVEATEEDIGVDPETLSTEQLLKPLADEFKASLTSCKGIKHSRLVELGYQPNPQVKAGKRWVLSNPVEVLKSYLLQQYPGDEFLISKINEILCLITTDGTVNRVSGKKDGKSYQGIWLEFE